MAIPFSKQRLSPEDSALILIDHQSAIMQLVHHYPPAEFRNNVLAPANLGKAHDLPTVLNTSYDEGPNGPLIPELRAMYPDAPLIRRPGQISAWENEDFVAAVKATERKKLIMASVTTDMCLAFPAMQAAEEGFTMYAVVNASGANDAATQQMAVQRMSAASVIPVNWIVVAAELQRDWRLPSAPRTGEIFHQHLHNYGMLIDNFAAQQAARSQ